MSGLFGTLNLGSRALQAQSQGMSVAGQNLANVNNPAYSRQRLVVQTSTTIPSSVGPQGTGVAAIAIQRIHDTLLDRQIQSEGSSGGYWSAQQNSLRFAQTGLGEAIGSGTQGADGATATGAVSTSTLSSDLDGLFSEFHNLASSPTSLPQRAALVSRAQQLTTQFRGADARLDAVGDALNRSIESDVAQSNQLLSSIAGLNDQIRRSEAGGGSANDLRDLRQEKIESLSKLTNFDSVEDVDGQVTLSVGGEVLVSGKQVVAGLGTRDAGNGRLLVQTSGGNPLTLTGGSIQGTIDARDGDLASMRSDLDRLASSLAQEVNSIHKAGFDANGGSGADFFTGGTAANIGVNPDLIANPNRVQASGVAGASGDNKTALALAALGDRPIASLGQQTFSSAYGRTVAANGAGLAKANEQVENQQLVANLLQTQRDSTSGVSIDEEMTDLVKYQKAFQASARIVSVVDQMLDDIIQMKR